MPYLYFNTLIGSELVNMWIVTSINKGTERDTNGVGWNMSTGVLICINQYSV